MDRKELTIEEKEISQKSPDYMINILTGFNTNLFPDIFFSNFIFQSWTASKRSTPGDSEKLLNWKCFHKTIIIITIITTIIIKW